MDRPDGDARLWTQVLATWKRAFPEVTEPLDRPGTSLVVDRDLEPDGWVTLWPVGERVVVPIPPALAPSLTDRLRASPPDHRATPTDVAACWPERATQRQRQHLHVLDPATFRSAARPPGLRVRRLDEADRADLEAFLGRCTEEDRDEGDVGIGGEHERTVGVVDGGRIVAVASTFEWRGFEDIGILVDPEARRRGAGSAAVSELCRWTLEGPRVTVYRHTSDNHGSAGIARSLGFVPIGVADSVRPVADLDR